MRNSHYYTLWNIAFYEQGGPRSGDNLFEALWAPTLRYVAMAKLHFRSDGTSGKSEMWYEIVVGRTLQQHHVGTAGPKI